jgi:hypothetical protein
LKADVEAVWKPKAECVLKLKAELTLKVATLQAYSYLARGCDWYIVEFDMASQFEFAVLGVAFEMAAVFKSVPKSMPTS